MPDETGAAGGEAKSDSTVLRLGLATIAGAVALGMVYLLQGQGFEMSYGGGKGTLKVERSDSLEAVILRALEKDRELAEGDLAQLGFHSMHSVKVADELRRLKDDEVAMAIREVLWDLDGPFALPGTFAGADKRLISALEDLDRVKTETGQISELLAEIVLMSVDRRGVFQPRDFAGEVRRLPGSAVRDGLARVYVCPGSPLVGKDIRITLQHASRDDPETEDFTIFPGVIVQDPSRMRCDGPFRKLTELLAGAPAELGLDADDFARLTAGAPPGGLPTRGLKVTFTVHPTDYTRLVLPPT